MRARGRVALLSLFGLLRMVIYLLPERFLLPQPQFLPLFCPRPFMPRPHLLSWPVPPVSVMLFLLAPAAHCPASLPVFGPRPFGPVPFIPGMIHLLCGISLRFCRYHCFRQWCCCLLCLCDAVFIVSFFCDSEMEIRRVPGAPGQLTCSCRLRYEGPSRWPVPLPRYFWPRQGSGTG